VIEDRKEWQETIAEDICEFNKESDVKINVTSLVSNREELEKFFNETDDVRLIINGGMLKEMTDSPLNDALKNIDEYVDIAMKIKEKKSAAKIIGVSGSPEITAMSGYPVGKKDFSKKFFPALRQVVMDILKINEA
jgi:hypothetical protein